MFAVVSRQALIDSRFSTVVCAPVYTRRDALATQVAVGSEEGLKHESSIHCDALVSVPKTLLTDYLSSLKAARAFVPWTTLFASRWRSPEPSWRRGSNEGPPNQEDHAMKWITRDRVKVDRVACPWLIKRFVDREAEFHFVAADRVAAEAERLGAVPFDVPGVELGHHGKECSFEAILKKYALHEDAALALLGRIVNGADTDNSLYRQPEGPGLAAIAEGFRHLGFKDDHEINAAEWIVYDALYAYCRESVQR